jgi:hypothetical protein
MPALQKKPGWGFFFAPEGLISCLSCRISMFNIEFYRVKGDGFSAKIQADLGGG